jgi:hypothetical protein
MRVSSRRGVVVMCGLRSARPRAGPLLLKEYIFYLL